MINYLISIFFYFSILYCTLKYKMAEVTTTAPHRRIVQFLCHGRTTQCTHAYLSLAPLLSAPAVTTLSILYCTLKYKMAEVTTTAPHRRIVQFLCHGRTTQCTHAYLSLAPLLSAPAVTTLSPKRLDGTHRHQSIGGGLWSAYGLTLYR